MTADVKRLIESAEKTREQLQSAFWSLEQLIADASDDELRAMLSASEHVTQLSSDIDEALLNALAQRRRQRAMDGAADALENPSSRDESERDTA